MSKLILRFRKQLIIGFHAAAITLSLITALLLRFDFSVPPDVRALMTAALSLALLLKLPIFGAARLYAGSWRFASIRDLSRLLVANLVGSTAFTIAVLIWHRPSGFPRSVPLIDF